MTRELRRSPYGKKLEYADLSYQDLSSMDLSNTTFFRVSLRGANLAGSDLTSAVLTKVDLSGAKLSGAKLTRTIFSGSDLTKVDLQSAQFDRTDFGDCNLSFANMKDADLRNSSLYGSSLPGADLTGAMLRGTQVSRIDYTDQTRWPVGFTPPANRRTPPQREHGYLTGPMLKLGREIGVSGKKSAKEIKRDQPHDFDVLTQHKLGGADFSAKSLADLKEKYKTPFNWYITLSYYQDERYILCPGGGSVVKFNIDLNEVPSFSPSELESLRELKTRALISNHPYENEPLINIGWIILCVDEDKRIYLIEEVQSAIPVDRRNALYPFMKSYTDRFFADAVGYILDIAAEDGFEVEMLTHNTKKKLKAEIPTYPYRELPASMGIRDKRQSKVLENLKEPVRWAKPNPQSSQDPRYDAFRAKGGTLSYATWAQLLRLRV